MPVRSARKKWLTVNIRSAGYSCGCTAWLSANGSNDNILPNTRGINVAVVGTTLLGDDLVFSQVDAFDTHASESESGRFVSWVDGLPEGTCVVVVIKDEASGHLTDEARKSLELLGSKLVHSLFWRQSFLMVGRKGATPGSVLERHSELYYIDVKHTWHMLELSPEAPFSTRTDVKTGFISVLSDCSVASILVGGNYVRPCSRGINVCEVDFDVREDSLWKMRVKALQSFDTLSDAAAADSFAEYVDNLPVGQDVILVLQDEAADSLTERAKLAAEHLGSSCVRSLGSHDSWILVGYKGAHRGSVPELHCNAL
ncbi:migration-inducing and hyaluronan-binding protein [Seminavis robusta]|uniref:Migration-inducing and hyaluronan-binding protein n=1 Tax=Seminavis robusta TaxID=568900 RepID=A0A9N8HJH4_9STRA|nr:migration-inducing and hyaluronan-binding protein [Seminavis robusta]|eukprot:Sro766_g199360.1 migration-inducing and hyaluronan-binding protein (313) ;mRNA; f:35827-36765